MANCCIECFQDDEIKTIIRSKNDTGNCDFCGSKEVNILNLKEENELEYLFSELISIYSKDSKDNPESDLLKNFLKDDWYIFNEDLEASKIEKLIKEICKKFIEKNYYLLSGRLIINEKSDEDHLDKNSIFKGFNWEQFSDGIRNNIRYHSNYLNHDVLKSYVQHSEEIIYKGEKFSRARITDDKGGFQRCNMGSPPPGISKGGRANPEGIPYLYLGNTIKTVIYEARAAMYDYITIGVFECTKDIKVINFINFDRISPFRKGEGRIEYLNHAINNEHLSKISKEIAKPLRNNANNLEYLPTQYICDFIKTLKDDDGINYDGIKYRSSMNPEGYNIAIFNQNLFKCINTKTYDVESIEYEYNPC